MEDDEKPPLRVVAGNPNARADKAARAAKEAAERAIVRVAVSILRLMAGADWARYEVLNDMAEAILAEQKLSEITGAHGLSSSDVKEALELPHADIDADVSERQWREFRRERGLERIIQGSLRLAAHRLLDEEPHFGGRYSERLVDEGIEEYTKAFAPPEPAKRVRFQKPTKEQRAADKAARKALTASLTDKLKAQPKAPARKKRWSPMDSRSYLDPKPEDEGK